VEHLFKIKQTVKLLTVWLFLFLVSACTVKEPAQQNKIKLQKFASTGQYQTSTIVKNNIEYKQLLSGQVGKYGGTLVLGLGGSGPKTFNPWAATDSTSSSVASLMFAGLVERDPWNGDIVPNLARSFDIQAGGKKIVVHLRKGLKWSDGKPITAEDVLFTWNIILKGGFERLGSRETLLIDGEFPLIKALDQYTVSFETKRVFAPLLGELSYAIAPAHYFQPILKGAAKGLKDEAAIAKQKAVFSTIWGGSQIDPKTMVVSGPFKLTAYHPSERIEYAKNPNYFVLDKAGRRLPYLSKLIYTIMPSDDLEIFKFASGEIPLLGLSPDTLPLLQKIQIKEPYTIYDQGPADSSTFIAFNMSGRGGVPKATSKWFNNKNFRKALSQAIDRQSMIDSIYLGVGSPLCFSTTANSIYFDKSLAPFCSAKPKLKEAQALLKAEGFHKNKLGQLLDRQGKPVQFTMYTNAGSATDTTSPRELMAVLVKETWSKLGIKVDLKVLEFNNLVVRVMQTGDWQTVIMGLTGGDLFEPNSSANVLYSDSRLHIFDQREAGKPVLDKRSWEAAIDRDLAQGTAYVEFEQRKKFYYDVQRILWEENPMIYLVTPQVLLAIHDENLGNFAPSKLAGPTYNVEQWFYKN
jgi:peptide/nickel transport system substrate-binding protein